jgi:hypothetical protein
MARGSGTRLSTGRPGPWRVPLARLALSLGDPGQTLGVARDYSPLRLHLQGQPPDEAVTVLWGQLGQLVTGGLPPSASDRHWWANSAAHTQAVAWLGAGRIVSAVALGVSVTFAPVGVTAAKRAGGGSKRQMVTDGVKALTHLLAKAGYGSIVEAVAAHTLFLHPDTVAQTNGQAVFPVVRDMHNRGKLFTIGQRPVLLDDNTSATLAFLWSAQRSPGNDVQTNHIWADSGNPDMYTALWNLCVTPAFLAKCTDGKHHPEVHAALRYRVVDLYGLWPAGKERPACPAGYEGLSWPEPPTAVTDLEATLRARMAARPKSPPAIAARKIGWLFSNWEPDSTIPAGPE